MRADWDVVGADMDEAVRAFVGRYHPMGIISNEARHPSEALRLLYGELGDAAARAKAEAAKAALTKAERLTKETASEVSTGAVAQQAQAGACSQAERRWNDGGILRRAVVGRADLLRHRRVELDADGGLGG